MKIPCFPFASVVRLAALCVFVSTLVPALQARRGEDDDHDEITKIITLFRTNAAPESARGTAKLEVGHQGDPTSKRIELHTFNLTPGTYSVTVFDGTGGSAVLGTFTAGNDTADEGEKDFNLPGSVNALNLTVISVSALGGAEVLVGDFSNISNVQNGRIKNRASIVGTGAAPDASGSVEVSGHQKRGKESGQFRLEARGLPANTTVVLNLNGANVLTTSTDRQGRLRIRRSARDLDIFSISTVSIRNQADVELAHAQF